MRSQPNGSSPGQCKLRANKDARRRPQRDCDDDEIGYLPGRHAKQIATKKFVVSPISTFQRIVSSIMKALGMR